MMLRASAFATVIRIVLVLALAVMFSSSLRAQPAPINLVQHRGVDAGTTLS